MFVGVFVCVGLCGRGWDQRRRERMKKEREEIKKEKGKGWGRCRDFELDQLIGLSL